MTQLKRWAFSASVAATIPAVALADSVRHTAVVDDSGARIAVEQSARNLSPGHPFMFDPRVGILWTSPDGVAIAESIVLSDSTDDTWVGWNLNSERLSYHQTTGTGTPIWDYDLVPDNPQGVAAASAEDVTLGVVGVSFNSGAPVELRAFDGSGTTPIWTYTFAAGLNSLPLRALDVAADGSKVIAAAWDSANQVGKVVVLDGATGVELVDLDTTAFAMMVELSGDASRAVLTQGANAVVLETTGLTTLHSFAVSGGGGRARISRDGKVVAHGGFNWQVWYDTGAGWQLEASAGSGGSQWHGAGIGLSADGSYMIISSYVYTTYLTVHHRIVDVFNNSVIAMVTQTGTGTLQNTVVDGAADDSGNIFATCSWGLGGNEYPEVQIFDRQLNVIGSIDTPGSPFAMDLSRNGQYLAVGTKSVHANTFGNGGEAYVYEVFGAQPCPGDFDGDGDRDFQDLVTLLAAYGGGAGGDFDGDGDTDFDDLVGLLGVYGTPCP